MSIDQYFNWICMTTVQIIFFKFYGRRYELVVHYKAYFPQMAMDRLNFTKLFYYLYYRTWLWVTLQVFIRISNCLPFTSTVFCVVLFLFLSLLCVLCPILAVCGLSILDCPFGFLLHLFIHSNTSFKPIINQMRDNVLHLINSFSVILLLYSFCMHIKVLFSDCHSILCII